MKLVVAGSLEDHAVLKYALSSTMPDAIVDVASDGYRAVELARRDRPDVVVVDPAVQGLSGSDLVRRLRDQAPGTAVVCWTARPDAGEAADLLLAGCSGYLLKEEGPTEVIRQLTAVLDGGLVIAPKVAAELLTRFAASIRREDELTRALAETTMHLQEIAGTKDHFVANVNHELRTPVTIVKGIAHLLKSGRLSGEDEEQFVKRMDAAVEKLTETVDEILSVSDLGQGRLTLDPKSLDVGPIVDEVCERMAEAFPEIAIERSIQPSLQALVDPRRISDAMAQLVDNACRFSPPGGRVSVSLRRVEEGIMFSVTDSGDGLARDIVNRAFREPFVTGEEILRKERAGLGVGLHLARQLVVMHGGIMWADPLPSGGSRVAFCIPEHSPLFDLPPAAADGPPDGPPADGFPTDGSPPDGPPAGAPKGVSDEEMGSILRQLLQD